MRIALAAIIAGLLSVSCTAQSQPVSRPMREEQLMRGRVIAEVASLTFGAGLGPKWMSFIFAPERGSSRKYVLIAFAFDRRQQLPAESFWDYRNVYELRARKEHCDTTVKEIAYEKNMTTDGKELPPTFILRFTKNSPIQSLDPTQVLPCYVVGYSDYRRVPTKAAH